MISPKWRLHNWRMPSYLKSCSITFFYNVFLVGIVITYFSLYFSHIFFIFAAISLRSQRGSSTSIWLPSAAATKPNPKKHGTNAPYAAPSKALLCSKSPANDNLMPSKPNKKTPLLAVFSIIQQNAFLNLVLNTNDESGGELTCAEVPKTSWQASASPRLPKDSIGTISTRYD